MIRIGICDDIEEDLRREQKIVRQTVQKSRSNIQVLCFRSGEELLHEIEQKGNLDIILLDIRMEKMNGVETARKIREKDNLALFIFVSLYDQYCKELIGVQPFAFVDKPPMEKDLGRELERALNFRDRKKEVFKYKYRKVNYKVFLDNIRYFESRRREICIHSVDGSRMFYGKLDEVEQKLRDTDVKFIRINKSYLVDALYIKEFRYEKIIMDDGLEIVISPKYKDEAKKYYIDFMDVL